MLRLRGCDSQMVTKQQGAGVGAHPGHPGTQQRLDRPSQTEEEAERASSHLLRQQWRWGAGGEAGLVPRQAP